MDILQKIVKHKLEEIKLKKTQVSVQSLENSPLFKMPKYSLTEAIKNKTKSGIIAEFKRRSPSKPKINLHANIKEITTGYISANAAALSVLTDEHFFGGSLNDLAIARKHNKCPILRKDFIIDEYQIIEAKSYGADAILLIAEILTNKQIKTLSAYAQSIGLEVLMEIHNENELEKITENINLLGVNNRNLKTFDVSIQTSLDIALKINTDITLISESGIKNIESIKKLKNAGFEGFLIGEAFMKHENPAQECELLAQQILKLR